MLKCVECSNKKLEFHPLDCRNFHAIVSSAFYDLRTGYKKDRREMNPKPERQVRKLIL